MPLPYGGEPRRTLPPRNTRERTHTPARDSRPQYFRKCASTSHIGYNAWTCREIYRHTAHVISVVHRLAPLPLSLSLSIYFKSPPPMCSFSLWRKRRDIFTYPYDTYCSHMETCNNRNSRETRKKWCTRLSFCLEGGIVLCPVRYGPVETLVFRMCVCISL